MQEVLVSIYYFVVNYILANIYEEMPTHKHVLFKFL